MPKRLRAVVVLKGEQPLRLYAFKPASHSRSASIVITLATVACGSSPATDVDGGTDASSSECSTASSADERQKYDRLRGEYLLYAYREARTGQVVAMLIE